MFFFNKFIYSFLFLDIMAVQKFYGCGSPYLDLENDFFEMHIQEIEFDKKGMELIKGAIHDKYGFSTFEGEKNKEYIKFIRDYSEEAIFNGACKFPIEYEGFRFILPQEILTSGRSRKGLTNLEIPEQDRRILNITQEVYDGEFSFSQNTRLGVRKMIGSFGIERILCPQFQMYDLN